MSTERDFWHREVPRREVGKYLLYSGLLLNAIFQSACKDTSPKSEAPLFSEGQVISDDFLSKFDNVRRAILAAEEFPQWDVNLDADRRFPGLEITPPSTRHTDILEKLKIEKLRFYENNYGYFSLLFEFSDDVYYGPDFLDPRGTP